jgi:pyruvate/2-oxoglutarate dehydrogenase complex dihydrolipoamide acyltransferase (E2) component
MSTVEILVPDLGDFKDVLVAEIFVMDGDLVEVEQPIASVETDKATMDIPSPSAGVLKSVKVALGDRISKGSLLAVLETSSSVEENPSPASTIWS